MCLQKAHNPRIYSVVTPPKTGSGHVEYTFKQDLRLKDVEGGLSTCFMTGTIR